MNSQVLIKLNSFFKNRLIELSGILLTLVGAFLFVILATYSPSDPNFIYSPEIVDIKNSYSLPFVESGAVVLKFTLKQISLNHRFYLI